MFVRGGFIYLDSRLLGGAGNYGYYWSSVGRYSTVAYGLYFNPDGVYPSNSNGGRFNGQSIRCVALGG